MYILAKVKFDLRNPDELYFAQREIDTLLNTKTKLIKTIASLFKTTPFNLLDDEIIHLINRLVYLGEGQGFLANIPPIDIINIVKKVTFFREIYIISEAKDDKEIEKLLKDIGILLKTEQLRKKKIDPNPYTQVFLTNVLEQEKKLITIRFLPFQTLFEYATEVKKLPAVVFRPKKNENWNEYFKKKESGIEKGIQELLDHLKDGYYRSPHFGLGKEHISDFVDWASTDLRKPFLHYLHKYKGKGDPRISRGLLNLLNLREGDTVLDPFVGSGSFIADAPTMGINAIGIDILNIAKMVAEVKCNIGINIQILRKNIIELFENIDNSLSIQNQNGEKIRIIEKLKKNSGDDNIYKKIEPHLDKIIILKLYIEKIEDNDVKKFLLVLLSQQVVEYSEKSRTLDFIASFKSYVEDRYLVLYSTQKLAKILNLNFNTNEVKIIIADSTNMSMLKDNSVDGIVTSPPYFDALDYIGNNKISILILGLDQDLKWETTKNFYDVKYRNNTPYDILPLFVSDIYASIELPDSSIELIKLLKKSQRNHKAKIVEDYLKMMKLSFKECYRVLKDNKYYLMVISKYHLWTIDGEEKLINTSSIIGDLGKSVGFKIIDIIEHGLSKADKGKIGIEDILMFQK